ncbi:MAG: hypothetical protein KGI38_04300 [Thaumarchaeota archaeon]|nr:hypothetical protein [Nitrososphaerota archaeon]
MIAFWFIFPSIVLATFIPAYFALYLVPRLKFIHVRYLAAVGVGLSFWYFFDTIGDATSLGENNSVYPPYLFGGLPHFALIGAFVLGVATLATFDHFAVPMPGPPGPGRSSLFLISLAVALVMGIHGLGEGWDAVSVVSSGPPVSATGLQALIEAFGTFPAVLSYPLHKFLEASIVAVLYTAYVSRAAGDRCRWWEVPLLGFLFAGPSAVGAALGYFASFDTTYFFAFGAAGALYSVLRLVERTSPNFKLGEGTPSHYGWALFAALTAGFFLLYFAALLH